MAERARGPRILILGLPYFGELLANELRARGWRAEFAPHPGRSAGGWLRLAIKLIRARALYLIGSRADVRSPQDFLLRIWRRPCVIHWVGTDAQIAADAHARGGLSARVAKRPTHWCDAPWLVDELATMGMAAEYVTLPVVGLALGKPPPLPERFTVLLYLPIDAFDREVFDMDTLLRLPAELPEARFILLPSPPETLPSPLPPNLEALGWQPGLDPIYRETTVVIRLTSHDGTSFMVLEALSRGRHVIWTFAMPGVIQATGHIQASSALLTLFERHKSGALALNAAGIDHARTHFAPEDAIRNIDRRLRSLLKRA